MDNNQWPQGIGLLKPIDASKPAVLERKPRPQKEQAINCPRCNSTNTKFCYYNNYSLSQPRYFCKTCRRYWTEGGTLRNVPVGGGSRKNKRSTSSSSSAAAASASLKKLPDLTPPSFSHSTSQNPKIHDGQDLNLAYPPTGDYSSTTSMSGFLELAFGDDKSIDPNHPSSSSDLPSLELLKAGRELSSFMSMPLSDSNTIYSASVLPMHEFKPKFSFSLDGLENGYGSLQGIQGVQETSSARLFLPYEDLKPLSTTDQYEQNKGQLGESPAGYWNGMLGGGSW